MNPPQILHGNNLDLLRTLPDCSVDSIVTDPPYELGFMGKKWDSTGIAYSVELWSECLRVLKHGGHLLAFSGSRTYHRMVVAIEDAGFEIRDQIMWVYGSGFPKSLDVSKAIDKQQGVEPTVIGSRVLSGTAAIDGNTGRASVAAEGRDSIGAKKEVPITTATSPAAQQWSGWGTALKPAHEPIVMARKPLGEKTVAKNVLRYGTGAINIDASRVEGKLEGDPNRFAKTDGGSFNKFTQSAPVVRTEGRFPANFIHDGSDEVLALFPDVKGQVGMSKTQGGHRFITGDTETVQKFDYGMTDSGSAARFFYCAKAGKAERNAGLQGLPEKQKVFKGTSDTPASKAEGSVEDKFSTAPSQNFHPTVKPVALMRYLVRMVTPPEGTVLDPFTGSGTTLVAAVLEGFNSIGMEMTADYLPIIEGRVAWALAQEPEQPTLF